MAEHAPGFSGGSLLIGLLFLAVRAVAVLAPFMVAVIYCCETRTIRWKVLAAGLAGSICAGVLMVWSIQ